MARQQYGNWKSPLTAGEIQIKAEASRKKATREGILYEPIVIQGRAIAKEWWGKAWCENLERYADYESRLARGRSYVRSGAVIDLQIDLGSVRAKVQGSRRKPYDVIVRITPLSEARKQTVTEKCAHSIQSMDELLKGSFPETLQDLFTGEGGLFPRKEEISFACSCPDWAVMCKHVAAVLYGIGARLDTDPLLFFSLRGIEPKDFIESAAKSYVESLLENADRHGETDRLLGEDDVQRLFGL